MSYTIKGMDKFLKLSEKIPKEPEAWTCEDVSEWLRLIEMEQYVEQFRSMSIDGWLIFEIEEDDLINDLKVETKLHRKKIMKGINMLKEYKTYVRNHLPLKEIIDEQPGMAIEVENKGDGPRNPAEVLETEQQVPIEEEKNEPFRPPNIDAQTRHQDMNSKFMFGQNFGNFLSELTPGLTPKMNNIPQPPNEQIPIRGQSQQPMPSGFTDRNARSPTEFNIEQGGSPMDHFDEVKVNPIVPNQNVVPVRSHDKGRPRLIYL